MPRPTKAEIKRAVREFLAQQPPPRRYRRGYPEVVEVAAGFLANGIHEVTSEQVEGVLRKVGTAKFVCRSEVPCALRCVVGDLLGKGGLCCPRTVFFGVGYFTLPAALLAAIKPRPKRRTKRR